MKFVCSAIPEAANSPAEEQLIDAVFRGLPEFTSGDAGVFSRCPPLYRIC
jgi:hypothetical protein